MKLKIVQNWRKGWRWFSVWAFALIVFFATTPLPPEVIALLPKPLADNLVAFVAVCGLILRFVNQSKTNANLDVSNHQEISGQAHTIQTNRYHQANSLIDNNCDTQSGGGDSCD